MNVSIFNNICLNCFALLTELVVDYISLVLDIKLFKKVHAMCLTTINIALKSTHFLCTVVALLSDDNF